MTSTSKSLRELDRVEDRIRQHRQVASAPIVIVEGPDDKLVLKKHLPESEIFPANGRSNVVRALRTLSAWSISGTVGIVDSDFDGHADLDALGDVIYRYESRDLEAMLIGLGVLSLVLEHQGSSGKLANCGGAEILVQRLVDAVAPVTSLRSASAKQGWGLAFDRVSIAGKLDRRSLELRLESYCAAILQVSQSSAGRSDLDDAVAYDPPDGLGPRGRDVVEAAGVALRHVAGSHGTAAVTEAVLTAQLHSSAGLALAESDWLEGLRSRITALSPP